MGARSPSDWPKALILRYFCFGRQVPALELKFAE